jgi:hypothetical protein
MLLHRIVSQSVNCSHELNNAADNRHFNGQFLHRYFISFSSKFYFISGAPEPIQSVHDNNIAVGHVTKSSMLIG